MTFLKGIFNNADILSRQNCSCEEVEEESCEVATGSGTDVTGDVDIKSVVGEGKK